MWVELWTVIGRISLDGIFELPHDPCGVPITLVHSHSDFPKRSYRYDLTAVARHKRSSGASKKCSILLFLTLTGGRSDRTREGGRGD